MNAIANYGKNQLVKVLETTLPQEVFTEVLVIVDSISDDKAQLGWLRNLVGSFLHGTTDSLQKYARELKYFPVSVRVFIEDPYFMDAKNVLYPEVLKALADSNSGDYDESILTGAIGTGKSTIALYSTAYQLYLLSCYVSPHSVFNLDASSEIIMVFQSLTEKLAKAVSHDRFKSMIEKSPYFREKFMFDKHIVSELRFPNRIIVKPVSGKETGAIGQNVIGGIIDELNFMAVVEKSKASIDGATYDQAVALYNSISRRRKSRFMSKGNLPGLLCLVSSKRYPGQFTDIKIDEEAKDKEAHGKSKIYIYDKTTWDILPPDRFSGEWVLVYAGDDANTPRVLEDGETITPVMRPNVIKVPVEYRTEFENDIYGALRDIAGRTTIAKFPYIIDRSAIADCFRKKKPQIVSRTYVDFVTKQLEVYPERFVKPALPRWCHIDLGVTSDNAGVCIGHVEKFKRVVREDYIETLPLIEIDLAMSVFPPKGGEINFAKIRMLLYTLRKHGMNIRWVSFDSFQSVDMIQLLSAQGFAAGRVSMDTSMMPYAITKTAIMDGRINCPENPRLMLELNSLEYDPKRNKVDHPPRGSKDIADALAGVVQGLTCRREIWFNCGVPISEIPPSLVQAMAAADKREKSAEDRYRSSQPT